MTTQTHTTTITLFGYLDFEVEVECSIAGAERDVGIMSDYIDDWHVSAVDGETDKEVVSWIDKLIGEEYGDEAFVAKLHDEGAADYDYDDYPDYDYED